MPSNLLERKNTHFVLWRPRNTDPLPRLIIGQFRPGNPPSFIEHIQIDLQRSGQASDLYEIPASQCNLVDGQIYHYWFEVIDSNPYKERHPAIRCTDPTAWTVDWRLLAPRLAAPFTEDDRDPAGVVMFNNGRLVACDPGGELPDWSGDGQLRISPPTTAW